MEMTQIVTENNPNESIPEKKGIPGSTLKWIAIIAMLIDHIGAAILESYLQIATPGNMNEMSAEEMQKWVLAHPAFVAVGSVDSILRLIGRFGFPIFAFLLVEGFTHTRSVKKYVRNLIIFALVSEIPFDLAFAGRVFYPGYQNVFCTLAIGVMVLAGIHYFETKEYQKEESPIFFLSAFLCGAMFAYLFLTSMVGFFLPVDRFGLIFWIILGVAGVIGLIVMSVISKKWDAKKKLSFTYGMYPLIAGLIIADLLVTDYSAWGVFTIVVMYLFRNNKVKEMALGCLMLTIMSVNEVSAFLMLLPVKKYNGERGMNLKYFFYAFYPVHLLILYLITLALGYTTFSFR